MRMYFITPKELAAFLRLEDDETICKMCASGELEAIKVGTKWRITTIGLRKKWPLSVEFWQEIVEDVYRELDHKGAESAMMRLERRRQGKDPTTGEKISTNQRK